MSIDDLEQLCSEWTAEFSERTEVGKVGRVVLAVLPVVRAAVDLHESDYIDATMGGGICVEDRDLYAKLAALYDAVDSMRHEMGSE